MITILLIVLIVLIISALPTWPYSADWGYHPSSGLGLVLIVLLISFLAGRLGTVQELVGIPLRSPGHGR